MRMFAMATIHDVVSKGHDMKPLGEGQGNALSSLILYVCFKERNEGTEVSTLVTTVLKVGTQHVRHLFRAHHRLSTK